MYRIREYVLLCLSIKVMICACTDTAIAMGPHLIHHEIPATAPSPNMNILGGSSHACVAQSNSMALTEVCISFNRLCSLIMSTFPCLCVFVPVFVLACDVCLLRFQSVQFLFKSSLSMSCLQSGTSTLSYYVANLHGHIIKQSRITI